MAERAGLRACRRCRPDAAVESGLALCNAVIDAVGARPVGRWSDQTLLARGFEPVQVRRAFLEQFGHTFHAHVRALRISKARESVSAGRSLSDAGARSGFESESGLRAAFRAVLDSTPKQARDRATVKIARIPSPLGPLTAAANENGVCLLEFDGTEHEKRGPSERTQTRLRHIARQLEAAPVVGTNPHLENLAVELEEWFRGERRHFDVPCALVGTAFELAVWRRLADIAFAATASYGEIARDLGKPNSARAVGRANAMNPIAILVPCHRVVGASGELTGYAGGLDRKRWLLAHERSIHGA
jgi:AraC family transcriptional regulator of adaptative response/methylated-DNA-[protein]-cysteine methyltransferase